MLTIVTGVPGAGKTLFCIERLMKEFRLGKDEVFRNIFVNGIPDLDYRYLKAKELEEPEKWFECPDGSVIMIDEAQRVFPQRSAGHKVPDHVQEFATHRHKGFDVFLTTQDGFNIDAFTRRMCGRHYHISRILNREMATVYEFDHFESNPSGYHEKKATISTFSWKFPKKLYERYHSATQHTFKARTPWKIWAIPILAIGVVALLWFAIHRISNKVAGVTDVQADRLTESGVIGGAAATQGYSGRDSKHWEVLSKENFTNLFTPIIPGLLHTAPFYSDVFEAKTFPRPLCITYQSSRDAPEHDVCKCFTQQITSYETPDTTCRFWVKHGWFNPTKEDRKRREGGRMQAQASRPPLLE